MKKERDGVIVHWIAKDFSLRCEFIWSYQLKKGATYESESSWVTGDAKHYEIIMVDRAEGLFEKERVERLQQKANEMRANQNPVAHA